MGLEGFKKRTPRLTRSEWKQYSDLEGAKSDEQREQWRAAREAWMASNEVSYDSGIIDINVDGNKMRMRTDKDAFGTIVDENDENLRSERPAHV